MEHLLCPYIYAYFIKSLISMSSSLNCSRSIVKYAIGISYKHASIANDFRIKHPWEIMEKVCRVFHPWHIPFNVQPKRLNPKVLPFDIKYRR